MQDKIRGKKHEIMKCQRILTMIQIHKNIASTNIHKIITRETGKLETQSPKYCVKGHWQSGLNRRHIFDRILLTSILYAQCFPTSLPTDYNEIVWCVNRRVGHSGHKIAQLFAHIIDCAAVMQNSFPVIYMEQLWSNWCNMMVQPAQAHNHGKYDNSWIGWYFQSDDDNKMSYKCILSIV